MIYVVMLEWEIIGYYTTKEEAEKYILSNPNLNFTIYKVKCLDKTKDLSSIIIKYEKTIIFNKIGSSWERETNDKVLIYQSDFLKSNYIADELDDDRMVVWVNTTKDDLNLQIKIAQDIFNQFLNFCNNKITKKAVREYNKILSKEEDERREAEKQEKLRQKELKELARLKAKYE